MANDFFFNRAGLDRPDLRRNEGGRHSRRPDRPQQDVLLRLLPAHARAERRSSTKPATPCCPAALTNDRSDAGNRQVRGGHLGPIATAR